MWKNFKTKINKAKKIKAKNKFEAIHSQDEDI